MGQPRPELGTVASQTKEWCITVLDLWICNLHYYPSFGTKNTRLFAITYSVDLLVFITLLDHSKYDNAYVMIVAILKYIKF
jgi:hypothetical protein